MIRRVYDRDEFSPYVTAVRDRLGDPALREPARRAAAGVGLPDPSAEALQAAVKPVDSELASDGARAAQHQRAPYLARDPVQSLIQSTLEEKLRERGVPDVAPEAASVRHRSLLGRVIDWIRLFFARVRFGPEDPGWVTEVAQATLERLAAGNHPFNATPAVGQIDDHARIVIVGDWGTGLPRARAVAAQMGSSVAEALEAGRQVHVIHLGDVYYSGTPEEVRRNVLALWPVSVEQAARGVSSWSLNGNHDMYGGGFGYFETLLGDPRFSAQRSPDGKPTSFFRLTSGSWEFVGLDTAWNSDPLDEGRKGVLHDPQAAFVQQVAGESDRKLMLLSHHQLYSEYDREDLGSELGSKLRPVLSAGRVRAWLWGHEHRCMVFKPVDGVQYARCIGHGGIPVLMDRTPADGYGQNGIWEERGSYVADGYHWARFGFAVLDLAGAEIKVRYFNDSGDQVYVDETFS